MQPDRASQRRLLATHVLTMGVTDVMKASCSVEDCDRPSRSRGWCVKHWARWKTHGDPTTTLVPRWRTPSDRLLASLVMGDADECWEWPDLATASGYGRFSAAGRTHSAHRVAYEHFVGAIPEGLFVLHRCDNPLCCNPNHLFVGTAADNTADMMAKGRHGNQWRRGISS